MSLSPEVSVCNSPGTVSPRLLYLKLGPLPGGPQRRPTAAPSRLGPPTPSERAEPSLHSGHAAQMWAPCDIWGAQTVILGLFGARIEAEGETQWEVSSDI